ncbi:MAG: site-specific DNA-methyltransferase [Syntrophales bacterium]|nr:site-specific DNA-methyltransferase [Syntrophales bacterium]
MTLRPCVEESKNWDNTENLYIEGDNLDVLKLLQESYLGKVKMIYIDPPYNTGNDFVYRDNFTRDKDEYEEEAGVYDEDGDRLFRNTERNGRFHSDWCNMMYPRLVLARSLLRDDGVICISIDDYEIDNMRKICGEVFGESNFVAQIIWQRKYAVSNDDPGIASMHEYIIVYQKSPVFARNLLPRTEKQLVRYRNLDNDPRGDWSSDNYISNKSRYERPTLWYPIIHPKTGEEVWPDENAVWRYSKEKHEQMVRENRLYWGPDNSYERPRIKRFLSEVQQGVVPSTWWAFEEVGHNDEAVKETATILGKKVFSTPKPVRLLKKILFICSSNDCYVLDFFSGSATTAHAVMQLNAEDGGNRKFIMVQLPEPCPEGSEAAKAGYANICEIGKERIRRAGEKIKADNAGKEGIDDLDTGFRVLKLDSTNMRDVYYAAGEYTQDLIAMMEDNIKDDRNDMDLLYACLLDWGLPLSMPHTKEKIGGFTVHTYNDGDLIACFDKNISDVVVREIAKHHPLRAVFSDNSFSSSPEKNNVEEIFKLLAPNTSVRVI